MRGGVTSRRTTHPKCVTYDVLKMFDMVVDLSNSLSRHSGLSWWWPDVVSQREFNFFYAERLLDIEHCDLGFDLDRILLL